jgi:hypothetical protein
MKQFTKLQTLLIGAAILFFPAGQIGFAQISTIRMLGSNSPTGTSYSEIISLDGGAQLIADDSLSVTPAIFALPDNEYYFEVRYSSVAGQFVANTGGSWFANFRLDFDSPTGNAGTYFWFEDENGPMDLSFNGWGGDIESHPFDGDFEVASFNSTRDDSLEHQFGIFSDPFTSISNNLGVDASAITGYGLGVRLIPAVPEPSSGGILILAAFAGAMRRHRR